MQGSRIWGSGLYALSQSDGFGLSLKNSRRRKPSVPDEEDIFYNGLEEELERRFIDLFGQTDGESEEW